MTGVLQPIPHHVPQDPPATLHRPQTWAAYAVKGGIGKSTLTANIAFTLRVVNPMLRVCVVNGDSNRVAQQCLGVGRDGAILTRDIHDVWAGDFDWQEVRVTSPFGIDVLPLGPNRHKTAHGLGPAQVRQLTVALKTQYDVVLVDLHPGAEAMVPWLGALDSLLLPTTIDASGVEAVLDTMDDLQTWHHQGHPVPDIAGVVINKWDGRVRNSKVWLDHLEHVIPREWLFPWPLRASTAVQQAETAWQPIARETSPAAQEVARALQLITRRWLAHAEHR